MIRTITSGDNLQLALDAAHPGDELQLAAGGQWIGAFTLPAKPEGPVIVVRTSATLPERRIGPGDGSLLATIGSPSSAPAIDANGSAKHWRFEGLRCLPCQGGAYNVIYSHDGADDLTFDRCLIVGGDQGQKNAIAGNGSHIRVTRCHLANIYTRGDESHGFVAWDGPGPFTIVDNYIEALSIPILFGGSASRSAATMCADIVVEGNTLTKNPAWKGTTSESKNLFELKSAKRVTVRHNRLEHNWAGAQDGNAVLFTVRNHGGEPWATIEDVLFEQNTILDSDHGCNVLGINDGDASHQATRIVIRNNTWAVRGTFLKCGAEVGELTVEHNTIDNRGTSLVSLYKGMVWPTGEAGPREARYAIKTLTYRNNLGYGNQYGVIGDSVGSGRGAMDALIEGYDWTHNVLANTSGPRNYPDVTVYPSIAEHEAQFNADLTLIEGSVYCGEATDGNDLGRLADTVTPPDPPDPEPPEPVPVAAVIEVSVLRGESAYRATTATAGEALAFLEQYDAPGSTVEAQAVATGDDAYALLRVLEGSS